MVNAVAVFMRYLHHSGVNVAAWPLDREVAVSTRQTVLTLAEIRRLYEATFHPYRENSVALGQRDRAIIGVLYGCGLRRQEALQLNVGDVDLDRRVLLVRSGKGGKQRYVPIAGGHALDMGRYLEEGRNWFLQRHFYDYRQARYGKAYALKAGKDGVAFFVGQHGDRLLDFYQRLAVMGERAGLERAVTPHGLRHSIATHLLHNGMEIEEIARFLGHASLASTQVYTHILNESARA
jgi:integrase/recombinase XerD